MPPSSENQRIEVSNSGRVEPKPICESNRSLELLSVAKGHNNKLGKDTVEAFLAALQVNYSVKNLILDPGESGTEARIEFLVELNRENRGELLSGQHSKASWIDKLCAVSGCTSALFYFLSCNPALCDASNSNWCNLNSLLPKQLSGVP